MFGNKFEVTVDVDLEDIIPAFLKNRNDDIEKLKELVSLKDLKSIEVIAHKLAGNAGGYGFVELGEVGRRMESAAQSEDLQVISDEFENYKNYMLNLEIKYE